MLETFTIDGHFVSCCTKRLVKLTLALAKHLYFVSSRLFHVNVKPEGCSYQYKKRAADNHLVVKQTGSPTSGLTGLACLNETQLKSNTKQFITIISCLTTVCSKNSMWGTNDIGVSLGAVSTTRGEIV